MGLWNASSPDRAHRHYGRLRVAPARVGRFLDRRRKGGVRTRPASVLLLALFVVLAAGGGVAATAEPSTEPAKTAVATPLPEASARDLSALLQGMRSTSGVVAHFTETKELALLSSPLEATGTIYFVPPGRLVRVVTTPGRSRLVVDGDKVRFEDDTGRKSLDLSASPMARQMIDSFVVLFNGDEKRLKELYTTEFKVDGDTWHLHLLPRSAPLDRMIASFDLSGSGARIDRMESVEPDGDRTVTRFGDTDSQHRFGDKELAELFDEKPAS